MKKLGLIISLIALTSASVERPKAVIEIHYNGDIDIMYDNRFTEDDIIKDLEQYINSKKKVKRI